MPCELEVMCHSQSALHSFLFLHAADLTMQVGDTPLIDACRHGRISDVTAILQSGSNVNEPKTDSSGASPLYVASQQGHLDVASLDSHRDGSQVTWRENLANNDARSRWAPVAYHLAACERKLGAEDRVLKKKQALSEILRIF